MGVDMKQQLPSGGPLNLHPNMASFVLAHLDALASPNDSRRERDAFRRRNRMFKSLTSHQRKTLAVLCTGLARRLNDR